MRRKSVQRAPTDPAPCLGARRVRAALLGRALLACLAFLGAACATSPAKPPNAPDAANAPHAAPVAETSVRPGANDVFLDPDLDVDRFVSTFEGESREIAVHHEAIVDALGLRPGMDVADVGAGTGLFLRALHDATAPDGRVLAVEIAPAFVEHLAQRIELEELARAEVVLCTERSAELPSASVDVVFTSDTYHHFEYPRSTLASLHDALRPGGMLCIVDFERVPGVSRDWVLEHVRAGRAQVIAEVEAAGFRLLDAPLVPGLAENYVLRFTRP